MGWEVEIGKALASAAVGWFAGDHNAKSKEKRERAKERLCDCEKLVRDIANDAVKYFSAEMEQRERAAVGAIIMHNLKRLSSDLSRSAQCHNKPADFFSKERRRFLDSISKEPFGSNNVVVVPPTHQRVRNIQECEQFLLDRIFLLLSQ